MSKHEMVMRLLTKKLARLYYRKGNDVYTFGLREDLAPFPVEGNEKVKQTTLINGELVEEFPAIYLTLHKAGKKQNGLYVVDFISYDLAQFIAENEAAFEEFKQWINETMDDSLDDVDDVETDGGADV